METKRRQSQRTCRIEARKKMSNKKNTKKRDTAMSISPPKTQRKQDTAMSISPQDNQVRLQMEEEQKIEESANFQVGPHLEEEQGNNGNSFSHPNILPESQVHSSNSNSNSNSQLPAPANSLSRMNSNQMSENFEPQNIGNNNSQQNSQAQLPQLPSQNQGSSQNQGMISMAPTNFKAGIPNRIALRDFFINRCRRYCPASRDMTLDFCKAVLKGQKLLLKIDQVKWIDEVPNYPELSSRKIWEMLGNDPVISKYFPVYSKSRAPHKQYLLNVINTIRPNSIATAVQKLKTKRFQEEMEEQPIIMTPEFQQFFQGFQTMVTDTRSYGLAGLSTVNYENCPICFNSLKSKKTTVLFKCRRHKVHKKCAKNYYQSNYNRSYLCPMRCSEIHA